MTADEPEESPDDGEPEFYILRRPHETGAADALGILSELVLAPGVEVQRVGSVLRAQPGTWNGTDFFRAHPGRTPCVSWKGRRWLEQHAGDYVEFRELRNV